MVRRDRHQRRVELGSVQLRLPQGAAPPSPDSRSADGDGDARADLLRRLAHEVRGPTGVTRQALAELELAFAAGTPIDGLVAMMRRSIKRFARLADRLSMAADLERGSARFERLPLDLRQAARAASAEAMELLARRGIELTLDLGDQPVMVDADARWLGVALMEICNNAIRFAAKTVVVRLRTGDDVEVVIEDDGPGFGEASPFESVGARGHASGLGLSLVMSRAIVAAHGGRFVLGRASPGGTGAAVTVALPLPVSRHAEARR